MIRLIDYMMVGFGLLITIILFSAGVWMTFHFGIGASWGGFLWGSCMGFVSLRIWRNALKNKAEARKSEPEHDINEPNNAVEPTPVDVTIPAAQEVAPSTSAAHLGR